MNEFNRSLFIKQTAGQLGFDYCGIAKAAPLDEDARRLELWLNKGMHGNMQYMEKNFELRINPSKLVPGAQSVITLLFNYFPNVSQINKNAKISKYAFGKDYHDVIKKKLNEFILILKEKLGHFEGRGFVDSAPVLERAWALQSGLGWIGKNGNLINKKNGSFFFIASLILDLQLDYDAPFAKDYCGSCTRCVDACPTSAILPNKVVDGSKCISYFTIELKESMIPNEMKNKFDSWLFGCDVCQDVCPWNRFSKPTSEPDFEAIPEILQYSQEDWEALTEESFKIIFKDSAIQRTKYKGIKRNLLFIKNES